MPCISIQMISTEEREEDQQLGNVFEPEISDKTPDIIVPSVNATAYNSVTGKVSIDNLTDLSILCPGFIFVDGSGNKFKIFSGISNVFNNKFFNIGPEKEPDLSSPGQIEDLIDFTGLERGFIRLRETIRLGVHAKDDQHLTKFLYYILFYIIKSRQRSLITRGIHLDRGIIGVFDRLQEYEGENIYSRFF